MDDLFGLIVIIIGIAAGIYSDKNKKEGKQNKENCGRKRFHGITPRQKLSDCIVQALRRSRLKNSCSRQTRNRPFADTWR